MTSVGQQDAAGNSRHASQLTILWQIQHHRCRPHPLPAAVPELGVRPCSTPHQTIMKTLLTLVGLLICVFLSGCAHSDKKTGTFTMAPGPFTSGGVTYYPAHPGTTNYGTVDYTTNRPPAGVNPFVIVVTTNAHYSVNLIDGDGLVSTNTPTK